MPENICDMNTNACKLKRLSSKKINLERVYQGDHVQALLHELVSGISVTYFRVKMALFNISMIGFFKYL